MRHCCATDAAVKYALRHEILDSELVRWLAKYAVGFVYIMDECRQDINNVFGALVSVPFADVE